MKTNENPDDDYQKRIVDYGPESEKEIEDYGTKARGDYQDQIEDLSAKEEALMYDNGPDSPEERHANGAVKGVAWLFGIVAVFAVAILLTWIIGGRAPINDRGADRQSYAYSQKATLKAQPSTSAEKVNAKYMAVLSSTKGSKASTSSAPGDAKATKASSASASTANMSQADLDRIEREAREVIHGDFGDNPGRKAKLGADYAAVQARVNQILH